MNTIRGHTSEPFWITARKALLKGPMNKLENGKNCGKKIRLFLSRPFEIRGLSVLTHTFCLETDGK